MLALSLSSSLPHHPSIYFERARSPALFLSHAIDSSCAPSLACSLSRTLSCSLSRSFSLSTPSPPPLSPPLGLTLSLALLLTPALSPTLFISLALLRSLLPSLVLFVAYPPLLLSLAHSHLLPPLPSLPSSPLAHALPPLLSHVPSRCLSLFFLLTNDNHTVQREKEYLHAKKKKKDEDELHNARVWQEKEMQSRRRASRSVSSSHDTVLYMCVISMSVISMRHCRYVIGFSSICLGSLKTKDEHSYVGCQCMNLRFLNAPRSVSSSHDMVLQIGCIVPQNPKTIDQPYDVRCRGLNLRFRKAPSSVSLSHDTEFDMIGCIALEILSVIKQSRVECHSKNRSAPSKINRKNCSSLSKIRKIGFAYPKSVFKNRSSLSKIGLEK